MAKISFVGYRFPPEIIQQAIWLYVRFSLSFRDVEDLLAERGIALSYETVRRWTNHFGPKIAADLRKRRPEAVRADLRKEIDALYSLFVTGVALGRRMSTDAVRKTEARTLIGAAAVYAGLA